MTPLLPRVIKILALLEEGPRYAALLAQEAPACFRTAKEQAANMPPNNAMVYQMMHRLRKRKLVRVRRNYQPRGDLAERTSAVAVWYELTDLGRDSLRDARNFIGPEYIRPRPRRNRRNA